MIQLFYLIHVITEALLQSKEPSVLSELSPTPLTSKLAPSAVVLLEVDRERDSSR